MEDMPQMLKELRDRTGLNTREFAEKLGVKERSVSYWERGIMHVPTITFIAIERIVDLVVMYGEREFRWAKSCENILAGF